MNKFLNLLFKVKFLFKAFIWIDYIIRYKEQPKSIELTNNKNFIKVDGTLFVFYLKEFYHYEIIEENLFF